MSVFNIALALFLIINPIGNSPTILSVVKHVESSRQRIVLLREAFISALLAIFFLFLGNPFLNLLHIKDYAVSMCGGIILVLVALEMIFPIESSDDPTKAKQEPFIVPIATPLLAGGGLLSTIMIYAKQEQDNLKMLFAILLASICVAIVLYIAPTLQRILGKRGMMALEQLMGLILLMLSTELLIKGINLYLKTN